ncbi:hypothetical protein GCM10027578_41720 [Spirosoma luteolum]
MLPLVSVIIATYNRSNVLSYSIRSLQAQTVTDWELIVVGDACTDNTADVVAQFQDDRIRFINLPRNIGEQSGPNNVGMGEARGAYIAFLNHDDFWFPDHLAVALQTLTTQSADFALATGLVIQPDKSIYYLGVMPKKQFLPNAFVPASGWVFRREVLAKVPAWRSYRDLWIYPSHDFLRRAYQAGLRLEPTHQFTFLAIPSGNRVNSYRERQQHEHDYYFEYLIRHPERRAELLMTVLAQANNELHYRSWPLIWQGVKNLIKLPLIRRGIVTIEWRMMLKHPRKGDALQALRAVRGLAKLP